MNGAHIDALLDGLIKPLGLWQICIVVFTSLSFPSTFLLPVFFNSFPKHRCRVESKLEAWYQKTNHSLLNEMNNISLDFEKIANTIGPLEGTRGIHHSCKRYVIEANSNDSVSNLILLYKHASLSDKLESCTNGYVYEFKEYQYQGGIVREWDLVCDKSWQIPFNESAYLAGMLIGYICGGWLSDRIGRRKAIIYAGICESAAGIGVCLSVNHIMYIILRFLIAVFLTTRGSAFTVLLTEITTAKYRSILSAISTIIQLSVQRVLLGIFAKYITEWRILNGLILMPNTLIILSIVFLPESPKWLAANGNSEKAGEVLYRGYKTNRFLKCRCCSKEESDELTRDEFMERIGVKSRILKISFNPISENESVPQGDKVTICTLFSPSMIRTTLLTIVLLTGQITCIFGLTFYASNIRQHVSIVVIINALANIPGALLAAVLYRFFRYRKKPLAAMFATTATFLWISALYTLIFMPSTDRVLNILVNAAILFLSASQRMLFLYIPELYKPLCRNLGFGLAAGLARIGALSFPIINRLDASTIHGLPLAIYAGIITIQLFVLSLLRDTNGESSFMLVAHSELMDT